MRSQTFAKSLPMAMVKGALKRLDMLRTMPELKQKLWANTNGLQSGLRAAGFDLGETGDATGFGAAFDEDDDSAETRVSDAVDEELSLESVGSGSGLLDLTRESDDTSLGAELLDEVWEGGDSGEFGASASGLFETTGGGGDATPSTTPAAEVPMGLAVPMMSEAYDGK